MKLSRSFHRGGAWLFGTAALLLTLLGTRGYSQRQAAPGPQAGSPEATRFATTTSSQPLALDGDDQTLVVANPDNDSVTIFDVQSDRNRKLAEIQVGGEPNGVALSPDGRRAYVANTVSGTVSVLVINRTGPRAARLLTNIAVGAEPYGLALTPNGRKLYVTNARSNSVSVIDTQSNRVIKTIANVGIEPRGIAITNNGDDNDLDEYAYVTQFLALPLPGKLDGEDDSKAGFVTIISTADDSIFGTIQLNPVADTGFKAAGDAIGRTAPPATITDADLKFTTGAYPNQLNNIAIKGSFAYVPNTGASPNGPTRFDVNTQSLLTTLDLGQSIDAGKTINMHAAVRDQTATPKLFITQPWAIAFKRFQSEGYVVSAASNIVVKVQTDPITGAATVQRDPTNQARVLQLPTGKNPRGIVVSSSDRRAYVMNYISRDVTVLDVSQYPERVLTTLRSAALPEAGSQDDVIQIGKELYHTSVGEFDPPVAGQPAIRGRMSNNGWGACSACHPFGLSDNVVWIFGAGPRRTIPQHTDFSIDDPTVQRSLNWSAIFDEEEDFEANIRGVSGGQGLIVGADGVTQDATVVGLGAGSADRRQLKVRGINAWDAIKAYIQVGIRAPISPIAKDDPDVIAGQQLFIQANCQSCHGGPQWTRARVRHSQPIPANLVSGGQIIGELKKVGTFDPSQKNEVRATAAAPLGTDGFSPPSLLSLFAFSATFFHNGSANSLDEVMANVTHRSAGTDGVDTLTDPETRRQLIRFLLSIDAATAPIE